MLSTQEIMLRILLAFLLSSAIGMERSSGTRLPDFAPTFLYVQVLRLLCWYLSTFSSYTAEGRQWTLPGWGPR